MRRREKGVSSAYAPFAEKNADDPVLVRLAALRAHWRDAHDPKFMRRGLLDLLQELESW
jgi:hypothetical protein